MNTISIDSLKVRIAIEKVTVLDEAIFGSKMIVDSMTGHVESEYDQKRFRHKYDGITTSFGIESQVTSNQKVKEFLVVLFNSKLLHENYFDGIQEKNIKKVYDRIMSLGKVEFSFDAFMDGEATDVDYKWDTENDNFEKSLKMLHRHAKLSKKIGIGCNVFSGRLNKGIEFGKRETASPSTPFLKFYHKGLELINSSTMFYRKYIKGLNMNVNNLVRCETTIKNKKHYRRHGIEDTRLRSIVSLGQEVLQGIASAAIKAHLEPRIMPISTPSNMTPNDTLKFNIITLLMGQGMSYNLIRETLVQNVDKVAKSRLRGKLDAIYENAIKGSEPDSISQKQSQFFESVGWT